MGQWLGSTQPMTMASSCLPPDLEIKFAATQTSSGWSSELVCNSAVLASAIEVHVDDQNTPHLVYRHDPTDQLDLRCWWVKLVANHPW